jgi:hypothetical protein
MTSNSINDKLLWPRINQLTEATMKEISITNMMKIPLMTMKKMILEMHTSRRLIARQSKMAKTSEDATLIAIFPQRVR